MSGVGEGAGGYINPKLGIDIEHLNKTWQVKKAILVYWIDSDANEFYNT